MSISHPYLKQLKGHILNFCQYNGSIKDDNASVLPFFRTLEDILRLGLTSYCIQTSDGQRSYWPLIKSLLALYPTHKLTAPLQFCIEHANNCPKVVENRGRERLFLRCAANKGTLALAFRLIKEKRDLVKNSAFLDETWELPLYKKYELVPCRRLGVYLESLNGRLVVVEVESSSVADEDAKIECGDVVDELFGECMKNSSKRKFISLMSEYQGSPIYISMLKCINHGEIYSPLLPLLEQLQLCKNALLTNHNRRMQELKTAPNIMSCQSVVEKPSQQVTSQKIVNEHGFYPAKFCGVIYVGNIGSVEQIESGVADVLKKDEPKRDVLLDLGETDIVVCCEHTKQVILQHGYPEIASCGRRVDYPLNFSYIAGETTCTLAKKFMCYVFEANCEDQARTVLKEISRGFDRTHWAV